MTSFLEAVLRGAEALAARDPVGTLPDADLLRRFTTDRDQAAFAVLVRRHGPLVWGVCRNLLPADADAEDAFQATFLALVRGAGAVRKGEALGGWLHGVAYRVALRTRRSAARRKKREGIAARPEPNAPVSDTAWDELQAAVHEEINRLPEKLRVPFVLCVLQGWPQRDAAGQLGWKIGTLSGRLSQARQKVLGRLAKRGLPASVAAGATILGAAGGNASVPHRLCAKVLSQAAAPDQMSPIIVSLARGVTHVYATRLKILVAAVLLAGALTTGLGVRLLSSADAQAPPAKPDQSEQLRRALELLAQAQPKERWEYKFVPAANPLSIGDVLTYLKKYDAEGWEYCGAQDLLSSDKLKEVPKSPTSTYLVFKRPKAADNRRAELTAEALLKVDEQKMLEMKRLYDVQLRQALDQFKKSEVDARDQEAKARKQAVSAELATRAERDRALVVREQALAAEHAARAERENAARLAQVDAARQKELVAKTAQLEAELAKTRAMAEQLAKQLNDLKDQGKTTAGAGKDTLTVKLTGMDGNTAAALLSKKMPAQKIVAETWPDSIRLIGPANVLEQAREILAAEDKARKAPAKRDTKVEDDELTVFHLKSAAAEEMAKKLQELFKGTDVRVVVDAKTNSLLVAGPPKIVADIKALVSELDREKK